MESSSGGDNLVPCSLCGRRFLADRLDKHISICQKLKDKKRKTFDSTKQRAENLDKINNCPVELKPAEPESVAKSPARAKRAPAAAAKKPAPKAAANKPNWREQHEDFVRTIRAARGEAVDEPPPPPTDADGRKPIPAGFVECPSCGRRFSERAAERHLPWCAAKVRADDDKTGEEEARRREAFERHKARIKYKPGQAMTTTTTTTTTSRNSRAPSSVSTVSKLSTGSSSTRSTATPNITRKYTRNISRSSDNLQSPGGGGKSSSNNNNNNKSMAKSTHDLRPPNSTRTVPSPSTTTTTFDRHGNMNRTIVIRKGDHGGGGGGPGYTRANAAAISNIKHVTAKINTGLKSPTKGVGGASSKKSAPVMKFKERFPNHQQQRVSKIDQEVLQRRDSNLYDDSPKTVPGVRTGGMSPTKANVATNDRSSKLMSRSEADLNNIGSDIKRKIDHCISGLYDNDVLKQFGTGLTQLLHREESKTEGKVLSRQNSGASDEARGSTSESTDSGLGVVYGGLANSTVGKVGEDFKRKEIVSPPMSVGEIEQRSVGRGVVGGGMSMLNGSLNDLHLISGRTSGGGDDNFGHDHRLGSVDFDPADIDTFDAYHAHALYLQQQQLHHQPKEVLPPPVPPMSADDHEQQHARAVPRFCHNCGTKYPNTLAKFCYECGSRRFGAESIGA